MANEYYITQEGLNKLKEELEYMKTTERMEVSRMIGEAKSFGDLSENSEYDAAKNKESQLEQKILEYEERIKNAKIIEEKDIDTKKISVGCTVELFDEDFQEDVTYKIMGAAESDPLNGIISNESPVGKALLGKKVGDRACFETPGGEVCFLVKKIMVK